MPCHPSPADVSLMVTRSDVSLIARPRGAPKWRPKEATTKLAKHHGALGGRAAHRVRILSGASEEVWHDLAHAAPR